MHGLSSFLLDDSFTTLVGQAIASCEPEARVIANVTRVESKGKDLRFGSPASPTLTMHIGLRPEDLSACRADIGRPRLEPRRRLYGIGMGKTGTNVLASMFTGVKAAHEAESGEVIDAVLDYDAGRNDWRRLRDCVVHRDARLGLAVDVSNVNLFLVDLFVALAPDAVFVLTVRDPISWLDSIMNHYLARPATAQWRAFADHRFGGDGAAHPAEERILAEHGLYTLAGYLSYWTAHMAKALEAVPADRLLVVPVDRIAAEAERIAAFGGFAATAVDRTRIHEYRNHAKRPLVQQIPRDHLEAAVRRHCGPLVQRFFPGISSAEPAGMTSGPQVERP